MKYKQYTYSPWSKRTQIAMIENDVTLESLREKTGYSIAHLRAVINGRLISDKARKVISDALGISDSLE